MRVRNRKYKNKKSKHKAKKQLSPVHAAQFSNSDGDVGESAAKQSREIEVEIATVQTEPKIEEPSPECIPIVPGKKTILHDFSDLTDDNSMNGFIGVILQNFFGVQQEDESVNQCILLPHTGHNVLEIMAKVPEAEYLEQLKSSMPAMAALKQPDGPHRHGRGDHHRHDDHAHDNNHHPRREHEHGREVEILKTGATAPATPCAVMATKYPLNEEQVSFLQTEHKESHNPNPSNCEALCNNILKLDKNDDQNCFCWNQDDQIWRVAKFVTTSSQSQFAQDDQNVPQFTEVPAGKHFLSTTCQAGIKSATLYKDVATDNAETSQYILYPKEQNGNAVNEPEESKLIGSHPHKIHILVNHLQDNMESMEFFDEAGVETHTERHHKSPRHDRQDHGDHGHHEHPEEHKEPPTPMAFIAKAFGFNKGSKDKKSLKHGKFRFSHGKRRHKHRTHGSARRRLKNMRAKRARIKHNNHHGQAQRAKAEKPLDRPIAHPQGHGGSDLDHSHRKDKFTVEDEEQWLESYDIQRRVDTELMNQAPVTVTLVPDASDNSLSQLVMKAKVAHTRGCQNPISRLLYDMPWCDGVDMNDFVEHSCVAKSSAPCKLVLNNRWDYHLTVENTGTVKKQFTVDIRDAFGGQQMPLTPNQSGSSSGDGPDIDYEGDGGGPAIDPFESGRLDSGDPGDWGQEQTEHGYTHHGHSDAVGAGIFHVALFVVVLVSLGAMFRWCYKKRRQQRTRRRSMIPQQVLQPSPNNANFNAPVFREITDQRNVNQQNDENDVVIPTEFVSMKPATAEKNSSRLLQSSHVNSLTHQTQHQNDAPLPLSSDNGSGKLKETLLGPLKSVKQMLNRAKPENYNVYESHPNFQYESMPEERQSTDVLAIEPVSMTLNETMSGIESDAQKQFVTGHHYEEVPDAPNSPL